MALGSVCRRLQWASTIVRAPAIRSIHIRTSDECLSTEARVTCLPGLEKTLSSELSRLGIAHERISHGAKFLNPTLQDLSTSYLHLGSASHILIRCGDSFSARGMAELRRKTTKLPWNEILGLRPVRLKVKVISSKSKLFHSVAIEGRIVAGIYEALGYTIPSDRDVLEYPPEISNEDPLVRLEVQIVHDQVTVWMYASETPLHRRGYRLETSKAPLREDLAYAMLYNGGWRPFDDRSSDCLFDPLCGSGTIPLEGASIALGYPPGRLRLPPWLGTTYENLALHEELLSKASKISKIPSTGDKDWSIFASDRDVGAIDATIGNAQRAGVLDFIDIQHCAVTAHPLWSPNDYDQEQQQRLLVVTNPPFGRRVSTSSTVGRDIPRLLPLYQSLQTLTVSRPNTSAILLCQGMELINRTGWKVKQAFQSTHGGLPVTAVTASNY